MLVAGCGKALDGVSRAVYIRGFVPGSTIPQLLLSLNFVGSVLIFIGGGVLLAGARPIARWTINPVREGANSLRPDRQRRQPRVSPIEWIAIAVGLVLVYLTHRTIVSVLFAIHSALFGSVVEAIVLVFLPGALLLVLLPLFNHIRPISRKLFRWSCR
jgi:hypothetical protein